MSSPGKVPSRGLGPRSRRQSVTLPAPLANAIRTMAKERNLSVSKVLAMLAETGLRAEQEARGEVNGACGRFLEELDPARKQAAGRGLIRAVFGANALADHTVL